MSDQAKARNRLDAACWRVFEKRYSECVDAERHGVIAVIQAETAVYECVAEMERERAAGYERQIASHLAAIDQYEAAIAAAITLAERYANTASK